MGKILRNMALTAIISTSTLTGCVNPFQRPPNNAPMGYHWERSCDRLVSYTKRPELGSVNGGYSRDYIKDWCLVKDKRD
ncbi:hypothetical protein COV93_02085 [Candidatus Woesearchaeota archaeon CG11_big_fil_rev_8_21_14_0_20_43_8]|nr:MAG: hypothetical protein COV93_02085 [Candidatus Woesearchaeota archaeon CG11_big_fil_rev_8_21_14_0_20_43_8]PIO06710.1 MAG: hypothetical protein COT47_03120 [Candidatus Woesearchaeota archaeon CG08_land_8_20_14_0_20_43_7]